MSKGPGRIERVIEAAFRNRPNHAWCVDELATIVFPEDYPPGEEQDTLAKRHRVSIIRAADKVAARMGYRSRPDSSGIRSSRNGKKRPGEVLVYHDAADPYARQLAAGLAYQFTVMRKGNGRGYLYNVLDAVAHHMELAKEQISEKTEPPTLDDEKTEPPTLDDLIAASKTRAPAGKRKSPLTVRKKALNRVR